MMDGEDVLGMWVSCGGWRNVWTPSQVELSATWKLLWER